MTEGFIDSASIYSVVEILTQERPSKCTKWAWGSACQAGIALIGTENLKLAPGPGSFSEASGPYGKLMLGLTSFIGQSSPIPRKRNQALRKTKEWAKTSSEEVKSAYEDLKADKDNFANWLDWSITHAWVENCKRLGALFNIEFLDQITQILGIEDEGGKKYLTYLWERSSEQKVVEEYAKNQPDEEDFRYMRDAYILSALLRGRYHENVAQVSSLQIIHHPVRFPVLPSSNGKPRIEFPVSTERYLSSIILAGAFTERGVENRIACWIENVSKVRKMMQQERIDLRRKAHEEISFETAVEAARKAGVRSHPQWIDEALDISAACGVGILTSFYLASWESFLVSMGVYAITRKINLGETIATTAYERESRLRNLAQAGPGRIEQT